MANGLNKAILVGNLGSAPELKFTQGGQAVLKMRIATTESYADRNGERKERTDWHTVIVWGKRAEALNKILAKGRTVWVEGSIQTRSWEDKDGGKRYATEINARDLGLVGGGKDGERRSEGGGQRREQGRNGYGGGGSPGYDEAPPSSGGGWGDDDIPFSPDRGPW